jgi:hypothetical protein
MVCRVWRFKVAPKLQKLVDEAATCKLCSSAWQGIELKQLDVESPKAMTTLQNHAIDHVANCAGCPAQVFLHDLVGQLDSDLFLISIWSAICPLQFSICPLQLAVTYKSRTIVQTCFKIRKYVVFND